MRISTDELITVVNINHITIFGVVVGIDYHATRRSHDWSPRRGHKIDPLMKRATSGEWIDAHSKAGGVPFCLDRHHRREHLFLEPVLHQERIQCTELVA